MPSRRRSLIARLTGAALPLLLVLGGIWLGGHPDHLPGFLADGLTEGRETRAIGEAIERIERDYYRPVSRDRLVDTSIAGMVRSLRDQFSAYLSPREYQAFRTVTSGEFSGVGMQVITHPRGLRVVEVYDDSPAKRAGIRPGDVIVAADGRSLAGRSEEASTALIKGPTRDGCRPHDPARPAHAPRATHPGDRLDSGRRDGFSHDRLEAHRAHRPGPLQLGGPRGGPGRRQARARPQGAGNRAGPAPQRRRPAQ
jgi:hypothetical protein